MHELSIALSILEVAEEHAERHGGGRVDAIHLRLGPLAGVVKQALLGAFEMARAESRLAESRLILEEVLLSVYCPACAAERSPVSAQQLCCSVCGTATPEVLRGRELEVVALEIES
jgi:hydrogenase nickel incorporation protein HypA/HybF